MELPAQVRLESACLNPGWTALEVNPERLRKKFVSLRAQLTRTLANFRLSGMGDGDALEDEDPVVVQQRLNQESLKVYSSRFVDFCNGDAVLMYAYEFFMHHQLFESVGGELPEGAKASGTMASNTSGRSSPSADTPLPAPKKTKRGRDEAFLAALTKPVVVAQSDDRKQVEHFAAKQARASCLSTQLDLVAKLQAQLEKVEHDNSTTGSMLRSIVEKQLACLIADMQQAVAPRASPYTTPTPRPPSVASKASSSNEWTGEVEESEEDSDIEY
jgi:hypothetical protein